MTPQEEAAQRRREIRGRRRRAAVLAGGWGMTAQAKAWDSAWPTWRRDLSFVNDRDRRQAGTRITPEERGWLDALSARLNAECRFLARPWYRLLMQDLARAHHQWMNAHGRSIPFRFRWGGYPLR